MGMAAYAPISRRIFGCPQLRVEVKLNLFQALVLSRLLFNVHTLAVDVGFLRQVNQCYMRGMRMIYSCSRYDQEADSDLAVRLRHKFPSIDCMLARSRLRYVRRIIEHQPQLCVLFWRASTEERGRDGSSSYSTISRLLAPSFRCALGCQTLVPIKMPGSNSSGRTLVGGRV